MDEIDLGFCLIHVLIVVLPCGFLDVLKVYILQKQDHQITKMIELGVEYMVAYSNLFIQFE